MYKIPSSKPFLSEKESKIIYKVVKSGWISSKGSYVTKFENNFSKYIDTKYSITTTSGTSAIELALKTLDLKKNDEVLVPNLTFAASINAIINTGLSPKIIDTEYENLNSSLDVIKSNFNHKIKAILIVHLMGFPSDIVKISNFCKKNKIYLIEDVAESMGAKFGNKMLGSFGDIGCFSFFANKMITTGEGGMCVTNSKSLSNKMKLIRSHGMSTKKNYWHDIIGSNYRMTNMQASIGTIQLKKIKKILQLRKNIYITYQYLFIENGMKDFLLKNIHGQNVHWQMLIKVKKTIRDKLIMHLNQKGIEAKVFFYPLSDMKIYKKYSLNSNLKNSKNISYRLINLPLYPQMQEKDVKYIVLNIKRYIKQK